MLSHYMACVKVESTLVRADDMLLALKAETHRFGAREGNNKLSSCNFAGDLVGARLLNWFVPGVGRIIRGL
jgi:hypothetical protein